MKENWSRLTVDVGIDPFIKLVDTRSELFGVEIEGSFIGGNKVIEGRVEHADDLRRFVVYDGLELFVPEDGDGKPE